MGKKVKYKKAKFSYFLMSGKYHSNGKGQIREKWLEGENGATARRNVIMEDNEGKIPGLFGRGKEFFIMMKGKGMSPFLIEPEEVHAGEHKETDDDDTDRELGKRHEPQRLSRKSACYR